ncbi:hypothetical protein Y032_0082g1580 [Ancylostoma ceylanicum]|uniref:Uncharacterized protein n=1 Tax=Ancylostoma ceylanicum TaxID=53326 RepID=A0A016TRR1_9BILA|nr:hypothetical protein Y032_0082g1580 [Ancylostoma ceylanicum]
MTETQNACNNEECSIRGRSINKAKKMRRIEVQMINSIPQLSDVLVRDTEKIIEMSTQGRTKSRSKRYPAFRWILSEHRNS